MTRMILVVSMVLAFAPAAGAADGVLEINQACAVHTGCFSGDGAGFPVRIATPGSYLLTGNLVLPDENTTGIEVAAPSVSLDLGGFEIVGLGCVNATSDCTPAAGTGFGIRNTYPPYVPGTSVKNGSITGMGAYGVLLGTQAEITNLRVRWNSQIGIAANSGAIVSGCTAYANGGTQSNGYGILTSETASVSGSTAYENVGDGIFSGAGSNISGNTSRGNTRYGLSFEADEAVDSPGYVGNVISNNGVAAVFGPGVEIGTNLCNGDTTCP